MIRTIEGRHNHTLKLARKLQKKKHRREKGLFLAEGLDLLEEALTGGFVPAALLVRPDLVERLPGDVHQRARADELDVVVTPQDLLAEASSLGGAADVIAIYAARNCSLRDVPLTDGLSLYLFGVGDPGNLGTLIRSATAFGAVGVMSSPGSADAFGPRALRAGMGAQFLLPVVEEVSAPDLAAKLEADAARGAARPAVVLADPHAPGDIRELASTWPAMLVLGSERGALPELGSVQAVAVRQVRFDSLNVAMAGTILLYELSSANVGPR